MASFLQSSENLVYIEIAFVTWVLCPEVVWRPNASYVGNDLVTRVWYLQTPWQHQNPQKVTSSKPTSTDLAWVMILLKCSFLSPKEYVTCHRLLDGLAQCGAHYSP